MAHSHPISRLGGWEGYVVTEDWFEIRDGHSWCVIRLEADAWPSALLRRLRTAQQCDP